MEENFKYVLLVVGFFSLIAILMFLKDLPLNKNCNCKKPCDDDTKRFKPPFNGVPNWDYPIPDVPKNNSVKSIPEISIFVDDESFKLIEKKHKADQEKYNPLTKDKVKSIIEDYQKIKKDNPDTWERIRENMRMKYLKQDAENLPEFD